MTHPAQGAAGAVVGPPPVMPLQTSKKATAPIVDPHAERREREREREQEREREERARERELRERKRAERERVDRERQAEVARGGRAAAAAALEKPLPKAQADRRFSNMTEAQIMDKLRSIVNPEDPKSLYITIKKIGQGCVVICLNRMMPGLTFYLDSASGHVYVAKEVSTGRKVAVKQMDLAHQPRKELIVEEILVMKESQHANIVNFLEAYLIRGTDLWIVMEYMEGGALTDIIENNTLEEDQIASICFEVRAHVLFPALFCVSIDILHH